MKEELQKAIAKHKYEYPYKRTEDKKSSLHIWLIDVEKAAEECEKIFLERLKLK